MAYAVGSLGNTAESKDTDATARAEKPEYTVNSEQGKYRLQSMLRRKYRGRGQPKRVAWCG